MPGWLLYKAKRAARTAQVSCSVMTDERGAYCSIGELTKLRGGKLRGVLERPLLSVRLGIAARPHSPASSAWARPPPPLSHAFLTASL